MNHPILRIPEIDYRVDRAVAVISFANLPVNSLSHAVRAGLSAALERAQTDPSVRVIVLSGAGGLFSGGADIREFGTPASTAEPTLRRLIDLVEASAKPVIAAIAGTWPDEGHYDRFGYAWSREELSREPWPIGG